METEVRVEDQAECFMFLHITYQVLQFQFQSEAVALEVLHQLKEVKEDNHLLMEQLLKAVAVEAVT